MTDVENNNIGYDGLDPQFGGGSGVIYGSAGINISDTSKSYCNMLVGEDHLLLLS